MYIVWTEDDKLVSANNERNLLYLNVVNGNIIYIEKHLIIELSVTFIF